MIVCEGTKTEPGYFGDLRQEEKIPIDLKFQSGGVPKTLVQIAVALKRGADDLAKRRNDPNLQYDYVWCVFDIDEHRNVTEAVQQANAHRIELAISNPCFELWILLHFEDHWSHIERSSLQGECAKHLPGYEKKVPFDRIYPNYPDALKRALELTNWQKSRGCDYQTNPWTSVHQLTELIRSFK